jgi:hypothetical protein
MNPISKLWFIKLARKMGAKTDAQATYICFGVSVALIIVTIILYRTVVFAPTAVKPLNPSVIESMQRQNRTR